MNRRAFLGSLCLPALAGPALAADGIGGLRGSIDAAEFGVASGSRKLQTAALQRAIDAAAKRGRPLFIGPGFYRTGALTLPSNSMIVGVPGATGLVLIGDGPLVSATRARSITLDGIGLDGTGGVILESLGGLARFDQVEDLRINDCSFSASPKSALSLSKTGGWIERNRITGARDYALYSLDATTLSITGNVVADCSDGGILVHRTAPGEDGTLVSGNRIDRIGAASGGTGQWGNGINVYRAGNVVISDNRVADCAFSAIRSNGGSNIHITGNSCLRAGETSIYSEFVFQGAVITSNVVDGATTGISIANFLDGGRMAVCANNIVRNLKTTGPYPSDPPGFGTGIWAEADTAVTGNLVENAPLYGINLGWGPYLRNVSATGNVVRNASVGIAVTVVEGAGKAVIANNVISETPRGAIVGFRWAERVTKDLAITGAEAWPHLSLQGNN